MKERKEKKILWCALLFSVFFKGLFMNECVFVYKNRYRDMTCREE